MFRWILCLALAAAPPQFLQRPGQLAPEQMQKREALFKRLFGERVMALDPQAVAKVKSLPAGERLKLDTDGDGKIDTIYFIDDDPKHQEAFRPVLVKVIDQDGDMDRDQDGDLDSDLYVADWHADGTVDVIVEYRDTDHDNDVDEMAIYSFSPNDRYLRRDAIRVWWSRDVGDDNQLWYTLNYRYQQPDSQFRTHFGGDEIFASFAYDDQKNLWIPSFEDPFVFYDEDRDDLAEVVLRLSGAGDLMESMRYSFDVDNDTAGDNAHDYDFSLSLVAAKNAVTVPEELTETVSLRGAPAAPLLSWRNARRFGETAPWAQVLLTWDENDNNVDVSPKGDPHERWEGIINSAFGDFPQVGGPPCGPLNKRYELDRDNSGKMKLYYSPIDRRIHLLGADEAGLKVDYNYDGKVDMEFHYRDTDADGIVDTWEIDLDGDQKIDRSFRVARPDVKMLDLDYHRLSDFYNSALDRALADNQALIDALKAVLQQEDEIETYFRRDLEQYRGEAGIGLKIHRSREGRRYYQDLIRERYFARLAKSLEGNPSLLRSLEDAHNSGNYPQVVRLLRGTPPASWHGDFERRFSLTLSHLDQWPRLQEPVVLKIAEIRKIIPDFNPRNFVVVAGVRRIVDQELPSQADDLDGDGAPDEIVFQADLRPHEAAEYLVYYSPLGNLAQAYPARTAVHRDGDGWESERIAYRFSHGQLDFYGKKKDALVLKTLGHSENYHQELDWGMDVLDAGNTPGIGGIGIWEGDRVFPVMNPGGRGGIRIERAILAEGPVRSTVAAKFYGVRTAANRYDLSVTFSIYAGGRYSENRVSIHPARPATEIVFSPGFVKMPNDTWFANSQEGYFGSWGRQNPKVQEIGMAAVFPRSVLVGFAEGRAERWVKLRAAPDQPSQFYVVGDWRRGRTFPVAPAAVNWEREIAGLARRLHSPIAWKLEKAVRRAAP